MEISLLAYLAFGVVGGAAWIRMVILVNRLRIVPHISVWKRDLRQFQAISVYRKHYPNSVLFTLFLTCTLISFLFFGIFVYDSETTRAKPEAQYLQQ